MKIAYFDCPSGIAGNMILGALIDAGLDPLYLKKELQILDIRNWKLVISKIKKDGIAATYFNVNISKQDKHRNLAEIISIIKNNSLSKPVKDLSIKIFKRLAAAEAKVHGLPINKVHFHEVGAVDAIIDIVGACIGFEKLRIDKLFCAPLPHGQGTIKHAHGLLPNPAPATVELLKGVPTYGTDIAAELVTPTGAAIISTLATSFGLMPRQKTEIIGYGAGSLNLPIPNLLRLYIGEAELPTERDAILQIETNIDDTDPEAFPKIIARLMKAGALDAFISPILMKKERQGISLTVLCEPQLRDQILDTLFSLTTTFGARVFLVSREKLSRRIIKVKTKLGKAKVKLGFLGDKLKTVAPEYEDYKKLARKHHLPIQKAYKEIIRSVH